MSSMSIHRVAKAISAFTLFRKSVFPLVVTLAISGCMTTTFEPTRRDKAYSAKVESIVIWNTGGISEEWSTLRSRMEKIAEALRDALTAKKVKSVVATSTRADASREAAAREASQAAKAGHFLRVRALSARSRPGVAVEFYDFEATLVDIRSGKEVWSTLVHANFYSDEAEMANELVARLGREGLLP